jgi:outer membrane usher protein
MVVGQLGLLSLSGGYSVSDIGQGGRYLASIQRIGPKGGVTLSASHQDQGFLPFGTRPQDRRQKDLLMASAGTLFGAGVTAGVSLTRQSDWGGDTFTFAGLNVSVPLPRNMFLSMWVNHQLETGGGTSAGLNLIVPLENRRLVTASSVRAPDGRMIDTLQATQSLPAGPGWGWSVTASDDPYQFGRGRLGYNSSYGQVTAEASAGHDSYGLRFGANGSLGWLQGLGFASRRIDHGAFAVVKVGDVEGVPVSLSNQVIARTNAKGMALVPGLLPYQMNRLSIDPVDVPLGVEVRGTQQRVIPYARSGVFLDFPVKRTRNALVILMQPDGKPVPGGARVTVLPGSRAYTVARRGEVYLTDLEPDSRIEVRWAGGGCDLSLTVPPNPLEDEAPRIGPLTCGDSE